MAPLLAAAALLVWPGPDRGLAHLEPPDIPPIDTEPPTGPTSAPCVDGLATTEAGAFPCAEVDLLAWESLGGLPVIANDIWGWTDPETGTPYAIVGVYQGTAFVDLADPTRPVHVGTLPVETVASFWGDIKVYRDHAYIVRDDAGDHGLQVLDLTTLRDATGPPAILAPTARYDGFGSAHNLAIDEESGFAHVVGSDTCAGGLHMLDLRAPASPAFAGCFAADGYTHDAQCVTYRGPDVEHLGREICLAANPGAAADNTVTIVDVTDKTAPVMLSRTSYPGAAFSHQGWLTEDQRHYLHGDEFDELDFGHNSRIIVFDVTDLDAPRTTAEITGPVASTDHNLFVRGEHVFQALYSGGLRVYEIGDLASGELDEVAFFDTYPLDDRVGYGVGAWGVYPFLDRDFVLVADIFLGLFVLHPHVGHHALEASVDVRPGAAVAVISTRSPGAVPVAILGADDFDVTAIDPTSLRFGPAEASPLHGSGGHVEDVDGDGHPDLVSHYVARETGLAPGDTEACVTGAFHDGTSLAGCDAVRTLTVCGLGLEVALLVPVLAALRRARRPPGKVPRSPRYGTCI